MSPLASPRGRGRPVAASRFSVLLAALGAAYAATLAIASANTSPFLWGINLPAFLPAPIRALLLAIALAGVVCLVWSATRRRTTVPATELPEKPRHGSKKAPSKSRSPSWMSILPVFGLPLLAWVFWTFRARTHFLGDGIVWLAHLTSGQFPRFSEPLATEAWHAYVRVLRVLGITADPASLAAFPVICGLAAAAFLWLLARAIAPGSGSRLAAAILLVTLGSSQLYFGYIESYPITSVLIAAYLFFGVRASKTRQPDLASGIVLALVAAAHIVSLALAPSYVWLVARSRASWVRRALLLVVPVVLAAALFASLGFSVADFVRPFHTMGQALAGGTGSFGFTARGFFSARRWIDLANLVLLVLPVPLLLLVARLGSKSWQSADGKAGTTVREMAGAETRTADPAHEALRFLVVAAAPGLVAALSLVVPSSPAQDWDLLALVILPAAVVAVAAGIPALERCSQSATLGLGLLAAAALFSFVLVNADPAAGIRRFESLVAESAALRPHERAYGNEKLATYWSDRGDFERAFLHARRAVDAEPSNPRYWVKAGGALVSSNRHAEAIPYFEEALRRHPGRGDASYNLGICYTKANRNPEAVAAFRTAVAAEPDRPDYRHNLGLLLYATGNTDSARLVWTEVLQRWNGYALTARAMDRRFGSGARDTSATLHRRLP